MQLQISYQGPGVTVTNPGQRLPPGVYRGIIKSAKDETKQTKNGEKNTARFTVAVDPAVHPDVQGATSITLWYPDAADTDPARTASSWFTAECSIRGMTADQANVSRASMGGLAGDPCQLWLGQGCFIAVVERTYTTDTGEKKTATDANFCTADIFHEAQANAAAAKAGANGAAGALTQTGVAHPPAGGGFGSPNGQPAGFGGAVGAAGGFQQQAAIAGPAAGQGGFQTPAGQPAGQPAGGFQPPAGQGGFAGQPAGQPAPGFQQQGGFAGQPAGGFAGQPAGGFAGQPAGGFPQQQGGWAPPQQ